jgi:outer membrane protein OmpA-like peptidoglycan-associated protein
MRTKIFTAWVLSLVLLLTLNAVTFACFIFTPKIANISVGQALNNGPVSMTITGQRFNAKRTTAKLVQGTTEIPAAEVKFNSKTEISCTFDLRDKPVGKYDVVVSNSAKKFATLAGAFTVEYPAPVVKSIIPKQGLRKSVLSVTIAGTYFRNGAKVKLSGSGLTDVNGEKVNVASGDQLTCDLNFLEAAVGVYDVTVTNDDGKTSTLAKVFAVENQPPTIVMIVPNNGFNKGFVKLTFTGSEFDPKATGKLSLPGQAEIAGSNPAHESDSKLSMDFDLTNQPVGAYDVVITNPDGKSATLAGGFTVQQYVEPKAEEPKATEPPQEEPKAPAINAALKSIFFDFDRFSVRDDQTARLNDDIAVLKSYLDAYILIDGHADERGTREYNKALAAKRAETVKQELIKAGFDASKITVSSYGEDYPIKKGHNEESWWYNRRVDISMWDTNPATWNDRIQSILFVKGSAVVDSGESLKLNQSVASLQAAPNSFVILVANSKDYGTAKENLSLSKERLNAVKAYLVKAGVGEDKISTIESGKVYSFLTDNQGAIDNRVDLIFVEL